MIEYKIKFFLFFCFFIISNLFSQKEKFDHRQFIDTVYNYEDTLIKIKSYFLYEDTFDNYLLNTKIFNKSSILIEEFNEYKLNKIGLHQKFYPNGTIKQIDMYDEGRLVGLSISYFNDGSIKEIGNYKKLNCIEKEKITIDTLRKLDDETGEIVEIEVKFKKPVKEGKWFYYNSNGTIIKKEVYSNDGILISK